MAMMMPIMAERDERILGREIADRLEALRRAHGWTQGQLAIKTGLDKSTVYHILAGGRKDPPIGTVQRFARAFGVPIGALVGETPLMMPEPLAMPDTPGDPLASRVSALEQDLLEIAKGQREILKRLGAKGEKSPTRKRPKTA